ncbi:hypothetical protein M569_08682, partial [Genlisea aurea]
GQRNCEGVDGRNCPYRIHPHDEFAVRFCSHTLANRWSVILIIIFQTCSVDQIIRTDGFVYGTRACNGDRCLDRGRVALPFMAASRNRCRFRVSLWNRSLRTLVCRITEVEMGDPGAVVTIVMPVWNSGKKQRQPLVGNRCSCRNDLV